jgi:hypothetical protein
LELAMAAPETRFTWIQTAPEPSGVYFAECGPHNFEIRATPGRGYLLRMYRIRPEDSALLVWENGDYSLDEAKARAERLANQHVPVILAH